MMHSDLAIASQEMQPLGHTAIRELVTRDELRLKFVDALARPCFEELTRLARHEGRTAPSVAVRTADTSSLMCLINGPP